MEGTANHQVLCKGGCGFYGNPSTNALCSLCYKRSNPTSHSLLLPEQSSLKIAKKTVLPKKNLEKEVESVNEHCSTNSKNEETKKKKNRCGICHKKLTLIPFDCRCGGMFCGQHRYSNMHNCNFDYHELGRQEIAKNNPLVRAEKISKF